MRNMIDMHNISKLLSDLYVITIVLLIAVTFDFILFSTLKLWDYSKGKVSIFVLSLISIASFSCHVGVGR